MFLCLPMIGVEMVIYLKLRINKRCDDTTLAYNRILFYVYTLGILWLRITIGIGCVALLLVKDMQGAAVALFTFNIMVLLQLLILKRYSEDWNKKGA